MNPELIKMFEQQMAREKREERSRRLRAELEEINENGMVVQLVPTSGEQADLERTYGSKDVQMYGTFSEPVGLIFVVADSHVVDKFDGFDELADAMVPAKNPDFSEPVDLWDDIEAGF